MDEGLALLVVGAILGLSAALALGASRTGLPVLVAFLGLGMLLGSDGPGGIEFDNAHLTREAGTVGLGLILYEGGLQTSWRRLRSVAPPAGLLSTVGVVVTRLRYGGCRPMGCSTSPGWRRSCSGRSLLRPMPPPSSRLFGSRTSLAAVARTLEAESGGNDPMAIALTLGLIAWIEHPRSHGFGDLAVLVVRQLSIGLVVRRHPGGRSPGCSHGSRSRSAPSRRSRRSRPPLSFGVADTLDGSGFLAVYLVGLAVGSTPSRYRQQLAAFHEGVAFVAQVGSSFCSACSCSLTSSPRRVARHCVGGGAHARRAAGRRLGVHRCFSIRIVTVSCLAGQGCAGPPRSSSRPSCSSPMSGTANRSSTSSSSSSSCPHSFRARRSSASPADSACCPHPGCRSRSATGGSPLSELELVEFIVAPDHSIAGSAVCELGLPRDTLVAAVLRGDDAIPPRGSTMVEADDRLFVLVASNRRPDLDDVVARWRRAI